MTRAAIASPPKGRAYVSLRGRSEFARVYGTGTRYSRGRLSVVIAPGAPGPAQVAVVAGRRVGNAVQRNRAKRRLRDAMSLVRLCEDTAYIVTAHPGVNEAPFDRLVEWLESALKRRVAVAEETT